MTTATPESTPATDGCKWQQINPGGKLWICPKCEATAKSSHAPGYRKCGPSAPRPPKVAASVPDAKSVAAVRQNADQRPQCQHRGDLIRKQVCKPCEANGQSPVPVFSCSKFGECTANNTGIQPRIKACATCGDYQPLVQLKVAGSVSDPKPERYSIAPGKGGWRAWRGTSTRRPFDCQVTCVIPIINPDDSLQLVIDLLRLQTEKPYIVLVDTGSADANAVERFRASDVEVHYLRGHGNVHLAEGVSQALDLGAARALSPYVLYTHSDCFLTRRTAVADALELAKQHVVAGHQITERSYPEWQREFGHTFLMVDQDKIDSLGITWKMRRGILTPGALPPRPKHAESNGPPPVACPRDYSAELLLPAEHIVDTERSWNRLLMAAGIPGVFTGTEVNWARNTDTWIDHVRSQPGTRMYGTEYQARSAGWWQAACDDARTRIAEWGGKPALQAVVMRSVEPEIPRSEIQLANLGRNVFLGSFDTCDKVAQDFDRAIHIYHDQQPGRCQHSAIPDKSDLVLQYLEHSPLSEEMVANVYQYATGNEKLLIHCAAGIGRSPTLAVVCLAARGVDPYDALGVIARAMWTQYRHHHSPSFDCYRLNEIFWWLDHHRPKE